MAHPPVPPLVLFFLSSPSSLSLSSSLKSVVLSCCYARRPRKVFLLVVFLWFFCG